MEKRIIAIAGSHGFIGSNLVKELDKENEILKIPRQALYDKGKLRDIIKNVDVIINVAGVPVYKLWTKKNKKKIYESRIIPSRNIVNVLNEIKTKQVQLINASAIGVYAQDECYNEDNAKYSENFLSKVILDWEKEVKNLNKNHKFAITRIGIVMGKEGYLQKVLPGFKMGFKVTLGSGEQYFSYIYIDDLVNAFKYIIENQLDGTFNLTSPEKLKVKNVNDQLAKMYRGWIGVHIPEWLIGLFIGQQKVLFTEGQCVQPKHLKEAGFVCRYSNLQSIIEQIKRTSS